MDNKNLEEEKNHISQSYNNLINLHNQMLQMDIQKNEKSLQNSFNQSGCSERRFNTTPNDNLNIPIPPKKNQMMDLVQAYKMELEEYKSKSQSQSDQLQSQILLLKRELEQQF